MSRALPDSAAKAAVKSRAGADGRPAYNEVQQHKGPADELGDFEEVAERAAFDGDAADVQPECLKYKAAAQQEHHHVQIAALEQQGDQPEEKGTAVDQRAQRKCAAVGDGDGFEHCQTEKQQSRPSINLNPACVGGLAAGAGVSSVPQKGLRGPV